VSPRNLTTGSIASRILELAWPTAIAMTLHLAFHIVDMVFVGRLGPDAIAAVAMTGTVIFLLFGISAGLGVGTTSLIARSLGAGQPDVAETAARQGFLLALVTGLGCAGGSLVIQRILFPALGAGRSLLPVILRYSTWIFTGVPFIFIVTVASGILRGQGDMKTPMFVMVFSVLTNAVLDPLLIFGLGPFPELGVTGAALATVIARILGAAALVWYLVRGNPAVGLSVRPLAFTAKVVEDILAVGLPSSLRHVTMSVSAMFLFRILSPFGGAAMAAYGLTARLNSMAIMPCLAIGTAVITLVGQNVGAGKADRAARTTWAGVVWAMILMETVGITFFLTPRLWARIFTDDAQVIAHVVSYLRIVPLTYMFIGVSIVTGAAFLGAGKAVPALVITGLRLVILAVPGAVILSLFLGVNGVWLAIAGSTVAAALVSAAWFRLGTWKPAPDLQVAAAP